ncbi:MAG: cupin domain-containing protein [Deltaproteobacteria bacterium]|nr:cupin domain-containing protein [Deltaproteobacteria bacterium]
MTAYKIEKHPVHLGLGASAEVQPEFTGAMEWYMDYGQRTAGDGPEGRLVSMYSFDKPWDSWEVHPEGHEVVLCVAGEIDLLQEQADGSQVKTQLKAGEYAVNPPGVWHTADVAAPCTCLFITAGQGTDHRPR